MSFPESKSTISLPGETRRRSGRDGDLQFFQVLAEAEKLGDAAIRLGRSISSVSKQLSRLEERLGIALVIRDAHSFRLTHAGEKYYQEAVAINARMNALESGLREMSSSISGSLQIATSVGILGSLLSQPLQRFMEKYPDIQLNLATTGHGSRLGDDAFDCQILRVDPDDIPLNMNSIDMCRSNAVLCASHEYLAQHGQPEEPKSLRHFHCLVSISKSGKRLNHWRFRQGKNRLSVSVSSRFSGPGWQVREMAVRGLGIARIPEHLLQAADADKQLVRVLTGWEDPDNRKVVLIYPGNRIISPQLARFIEFIREEFLPPDSAMSLQVNDKSAPAGSE
mgnify:CR=1 FL=1